MADIGDEVRSSMSKNMLYSTIVARRDLCVGCSTRALRNNIVKKKLICPIDFEISKIYATDKFSS